MGKGCLLRSVSTDVPIDNAHAATTSVHENEAFGESEALIMFLEGTGDLLPGLDKASLDVLRRRDNAMMRAAMRLAVMVSITYMVRGSLEDAPISLRLSLSESGDEGRCNSDHSDLQVKESG